MNRKQQDTVTDICTAIFILATVAAALFLIASALAHTCYLFGRL